MILFFGDSLTSGENNQFKSYVDYLGLNDYINYGVSGTTLDDYSLYPVGKTDLYNLLQENKSQLAQAESIFIEYGVNDISSVVSKYTTIERVICSLIKCIDFIKQNSSAKINFILIGNNKKSIDLFAKNQINYLKKDYLKSTNIHLSKYKWIKNYDRFASIVKNNRDLNVYYLYEGEYPSNLIDADGIHPTDTGYKIIASNIRKDIL